MKHERANEEVEEIASLYALGVLSQHEARAFEIHLREGCIVCAAELGRFENVVAALGTGAPEVEVPAYLRDLLAARIERESRSLAPAVSTPASEETVKLGSRLTQPTARRPFLPWVVAAACAALAIVSFLGWRQAERQITEQGRIIAAAQNEATQIKARLDQEEAKVQQLEKINLTLSSPGPRVILLAGQEPAPSASATIFWDTQKHQWVVIANLPPPPAEKVYQLWFVTAAQAKINAGLIQTDPSGHSFTVVPVPGEIDRIVAAAITLEPEGGSEQPTLPIYALGKVG